MKTLVLFLTHNFKKVFLETLTRFNNTMDETNTVCKVLFDDNDRNFFEPAILNCFPKIEVIQTSRINSTYDTIGHSLYINYLRKNIDEINKYDHIWVIENDVYFHGYLTDFINAHRCYNYDLLVTEHGVRQHGWEGFRNVRPLLCAEGVLGVIMRFTPDLIKELVLNIDTVYFGFMEAVLPQICAAKKFKIGQFLPELCGVLTTNNNNPLLKLIERDILNTTTEYIERKLYHPIKL